MTRVRRIQIISAVILLLFLLGEAVLLLEMRQSAPPVPEAPAEESFEDLLIQCDATEPCPDGLGCYAFEDLPAPVCWEGDPCLRCPSGRCLALESSPMQIRCQP